MNAALCYSSLAMYRDTEDRPAASGASEIVEVTRLSYGPHGIGRLANGKTVFVRGAVPGELAEVVVTEDRRSYAYADVRRLVRPSPARRSPPCEYLPACGGCPWQHLAYETQLEAKEQSVRDALTRIGKIDAAVVQPILASPLELGYRSRLSLRVEDGEVGFYRGGTHELIAVSHCLLAMPEVDRAVASARDLVQALTSNVRRVEIAGRGGQPGVALHAEIEGGLAARDPRIVTEFLRLNAHVTGIVLQGRRWRRAWGDVAVEVSPVDGMTMELPVGVFSQVNPAANRLLVEAVLGLAEIGEHDRVLELHAGAGNLTLPLAQRAGRVVAVEQNETAADAAVDNARRLGLRVDVRRASAAKAVDEAVDRNERFDVIVLDPPRSGAAEIIDGLVRLEPARIVYVSCNPTTLARDLSSLSARYRVEEVRPIDMFPHTYHVESVTKSVLTWC